METTEAHKILIVDDNPNNIQLLGSILNSYEYHAEFATNGRDALEWIEHENFDIILLDVMMPELDGYEVCEILKDNPQTAHIPVIFITAKQDTESIVKAFSIGAADYVTKPFNEKELISRLQYHIELLTAKRELESLANRLQDKNDTIMQSIRYAEKLQEAMFPAKEELSPNFKNYFIHFNPLQNLSGDFYWSKSAENATYFVIGDSMGHGIPGALLSMVGINALNDIFEKNSDISPSQMLTELRIKEQTVFSSSAGIMHDSIDMAVCKFCYTDKTLQFSGANLPIAIISKKAKADLKVDSKQFLQLEKEEKHLTYIPGNKNTIGKNLIVEPFSDVTIQLEEEDIVYLFSDGYRDQFGGEKGQKFKKRNFMNLLVTISGQAFSEQNKYLTRTYEKWKDDHAQTDDITVIGLQPF